MLRGPLMKHGPIGLFGFYPFTMRVWGVAQFMGLIFTTSIYSSG
jgi:hypothetical protein